MNAILFLILLALIVGYWQDNRYHHEYAIQRCKAICAEMNVQLLDHTVALTSTRFKRKNNRIQILRRYNFEISMDGVSRNSGYILMLGLDIIHTEFNLPDGPVILQDKESITYH